MEHPDIKFLEVNVEEDPTLAQKFSIRSVPVVLGVKDSQEVARSAGLSTKDKLAEVGRYQ